MELIARALRIVCHSKQPPAGKEEPMASLWTLHEQTVYRHDLVEDQGEVLEMRSRVLKTNMESLEEAQEALTEALDA